MKKLFISILLMPVIAFGADVFNILDSTSMTISGGTINNTSIGQTTPAAGSFTTVTATTPVAVTSGGTGASTQSGALTNIVGYTPVNKAGDTMTGQLFAADGAATAPSYSFGNSSNTGIFSQSPANFAMSNNGLTNYSYGSDILNGFLLRNTLPVAWSAGDPSVTPGDVKLYRDAANSLAQRNGTNAQTSRLYNTFTDASNYERLGINWTSNAATITTEAAGTGTVRQLNIINPSIGASALTLTSGALGLSKMTASASAPGAGGAKLELVCGTNAGTAKLVISAGTSATTVTVIDNIGGGVAGC